MLTFPVSYGLAKKKIVIRKHDAERMMREMAPVAAKPLLDAWSRCQRGKGGAVCPWLFPLSCLRIAERVHWSQPGSSTDP